MKRLSVFVLAVLTLLVARANGFLSELPQNSVLSDGYSSTDSIMARLASLPLCPIEGLWQMGGDGALFVVERAEWSTAHAPARLKLVMVRSPWRSIRPGTVFGHAVVTAKPRVYEARIYSENARRSGLALPRKFTLTVDADGGILTFKPFKSPFRINLFRLLPYMYRRVITPQQSRPDGLDGAVRIFPVSAGHPLTPVYL